jgi:hypothetical protein
MSISPRDNKRSRHGTLEGRNPSTSVPIDEATPVAEAESHRPSAIVSSQPKSPSEGRPCPPSTSSLPHDLIKSSLEYLPKNQQLMAREVNQEWSRAVADAIESRFGEDVTRTLKDGEWKPVTRQELRSVLRCIPDMTDTFKSSIRKIRFPQSFTGDCAGLETIPTLEELSLRISKITVVPHLSDCRALRRLDLTECKKLTDDGILGLERIPTLEELDLSACNVTTVVHLSTCKALKKLNLQWCTKLTDAGIVGLERILTLEELDLSNTNLTTFANLAASKTLKKLHLYGCKKLTDDGIVGLERIPTLEELILASTKVTTVSHLAACKALKKLSLSSCEELTDDGILGIERIPTLEVLNLYNTKVTKVLSLSSCKALRVLNLAECLNLSFEQIDQLTVSIPTLQSLIRRTPLFLNSVS